MPQFLETGIGDRAINVADVERLFKKENNFGEDDAYARTRDGREHELFESVEDAVNSTLPVVKADPGYVLVAFQGVNANGEPVVNRQPVVAWRIGARHAMPVTPEPSNPDDPAGVLYPDGRVITRWDGYYETEAEWLEELNLRRQAELAEESAKASAPEVA
jgi:hypothetical protein